MSGLAHYIEGEGIPTTSISLVRKHSEEMKPPRALAVPFELGRPFGAPNEPDFQRKVLKAVLELLERTDGPILEDFPESPPGTPADMEGWACPVNLAPPASEDISDSKKLLNALKQEIALTRPWYEESVQKAKGRTMVGLSRMEPDAIAEFLVAYMDDPSIPSPSEENPVVRMLKLATDDIKHFYYEAAMARPGTVTDIAIANWFWGETLMGLTFLQLRSVLAKQDDEKLLALANMALVPHHQKFRIKD